MPPILSITVYYTIMTTISGLILAVLTFSDEIARKFPKLDFFSSLILKGAGLIMAFFLVTMATIWKDNDAEAATKLQQKELLDSAKSQQVELRDSVKHSLADQTATYFTEKHISDSVQKIAIAKLLDSSYIKSVKASNGALAKYNLEIIDSLHQVKLNPSSYGQLTVAPMAPPDTSTIQIREISGNQFLTFKLTSIGGNSYNVNFKYFLIEPESPFSVLLSDNFGSPYTFMNQGTLTPVYVKIDNLPASVDSCYLVFIGYFSPDIQKNIIIPFKVSYLISIKERKNKIGPSINFNLLEKLLKSRNEL